MNIRRLVPVLIAVVLIAFGIGFFSLIYNDNYKLTGLQSGNLVNIKSRDGIVKIGSGGIEVKDGDDHVVIGWDGINVNDGKDQVRVGWDGIKITEGGKSTFQIGNIGNWFGFRNDNLASAIVDDENFAEIDGVNNITISSSFIDIKVTSQDRDDVRIHYYGKMKSNIIPDLEIERKSDTLNIELQHSNANSYAVVESDVVLEVFVPKSFNNNFDVVTSSADIYMKNLIGNNFNISSSSGSQELENIEGKVLNLSSSSGEIETEDSMGEFNITTSSGDISIDNEKTSENIKITTSSGDVSINFSDDASYRIDGTTSSGDINYNGPISIAKDKSGKFEFTIGSGDKSIIISTSSGDMEFSRE